MWKRILMWVAGVLGQAALEKAVNKAQEKK